MFEPASLLKLVHALLGILLAAGLIGRWVTLRYAAQMTDVKGLRQVLGVSDRFERIVIATSLFVLLFGLMTAVAQNRPFLGPLQGGNVDWLFVSLLLYVSVLLLVPMIFIPRGRIFDVALAEATRSGEMTADLKTAFRDPVVAAARTYELVAMVVILILMIAKPF